MKKGRFLTATFALVILIFTGCGVKGRLVPPDAITLNPPQKFEGRQIGSRFRLSWSYKPAASNLEKVGFRLKRLYNPSSANSKCTLCKENWEKVADIPINDSNCKTGDSYSCSYFDSDIKTGGIYLYRISAIDSDGNETPPSETGGITLLKPLPLPLLSVENSGGAVKITVTLDQTENEGKQGYILYRSSGGEAKRLNTEVSFSNEYFDDSVMPGTSYTYFAEAVAKTGKGEIFSEPSAKATIRFQFP